MDYETAIQQVRECGQARPDGFMVIKLTWDCRIILPYDDGLAFLESLRRAEQFNHAHHPNAIIPLDSDQITVTRLSRREYEVYKLAALMKMSVEDAEELHANPFNQKPK